MKNSLLSVKDLNVFFKVRGQSIHAVRGICFELGQEEILGIVGESGSGKSAAMKALVHLLPEHSTQVTGECIYQDQNILTLSENRMQAIRGQEIGMIFQDPMTSLNPTMKIGEQILEGYLLRHPEMSRKEAHDYAVQLLELVGIPHASTRIDDYPHTLSGGMRQRVMIAIALAPKPKIIIADEPTTALDVTIQAQILDLMKQIKEKTGTSFILITHDMSVVAGFCDRVLVMYAGKVVEKARVDQLFDHPCHPYTQGLLHSIPRLDIPRDQPLIPIDGSPPNLTDNLPGCAFYPRCKFAKEMCSKTSPPTIQIDEGHEIACWKKIDDASTN